MKIVLRLITAIAIVLMAETTWASDVSIPNVFVSGTPAVASEVNENFTAIENAVDDNNLRILENEGAADNNSQRITAIESSYVKGKGDLSVALTGVVTISSASTQLLGNGTLFLSEISVNDSIMIGNEIHEVASINSDTDLLLVSSHSSGALDVTAYKDGSLLSVKTGADQERLSLDKSGNLSVTGTINGVRFSRMKISNSNNVIYFVETDGTVTTLTIADANTAVGNSKIYYSPDGGLGGEAILLFNIQSSPSIACILLHNEDDYPKFGIGYATDGGNSTILQTAWGNLTTKTFMFSAEGMVNAIPLANYASYDIMCF